MAYTYYTYYLYAVSVDFYSCVPESGVRYRLLAQTVMEMIKCYNHNTTVYLQINSRITIFTLSFFEYSNHASWMTSVVYLHTNNNNIETV